MQFLFIREFTAPVKSQRKPSVTLTPELQGCVGSLGCPLRPPDSSPETRPRQKNAVVFPKTVSDELLTDLPAFQVPRTLKML